MGTIYITPIARVHSTFADAKSFFDEGGLSFFGEPKAPTLDNLIHDLTQGRRNLIVGEPGVGKSELLTKIDDRLKAQGVATALIGLRQTNALQRVDEFLAADSKGSPKALLPDALDEVKSSNFPGVLQKIEEISAGKPDLAIFISGRWVFVHRHANSFPEYRFITISPFREKQVRNYLNECGYAGRDIDQLLARIMPFAQRQLVVQIPRYLAYLHKYIQDNGLQAASEVSRNDLFEYFIYNKLSLEEKKLNATKKAIIKRVLENLALTMEIYQTNVISEDELMTFFDDTKSELSRAVLGDTEVFYEYSLLKVSDEDLGKVEFENTEFQEYLAAKEITRLKDVVRSTFEFAVDSRIKEIYPSWYNALTFLVDMQSDLLEPLVEFSGLRADKFKVMDEAFLTFLSRIDSRVIATNLRRRIFKDIIAYHERTLQWLPGELAQSMSGFFEKSLESYLKERIAEAETESGDKRFVILGNLAYVAGYLLESVTVMDRAYWRSRLLDYAKDKNENGVLQRRALLALQLLGDPSVIDELPDLSDADPLITQVFLHP
ncbi:MAG: ATP-binding protein [Rhodospirillales bacterium]|nr:ATP-binding protein [Rhodospirillales bacterium]